MALLTLEDIEKAAKLVYRQMLPTPQYSWPLLNQSVGTEVWVKHENHTPTGAFKVRGGITFIHWLRENYPDVHGIVTATRGNHGQSQARAAFAADLQAKIVVPHGNSVEKNQAMRGFGAEVIEFGVDFDDARVEAQRIAQEEGFYLVPPFHREIVLGVALYAWELFKTLKDLDYVYVPIGCGSGICGLIAMRDLLGLKTKIIGVVAEYAPAAKLSFDAGKLIETESAKTFADGMAVRVPVEEAFDIYAKGAERIVTVSDDEVAAAMRLYYSASHNIAEGAGAAPLAALLQERDRMKGKKVAVILCGANVDTDIFVSVMRGKTPTVA